MKIKIIMVGGKSGIGKSYIINFIKSQLKNSFILSFANPMKYLLLNYHNAFLSKDCPDDIWYQNILFPIFDNNTMHIIKNQKYNLLNIDDFVNVNLLLFDQINKYFNFIAPNVFENILRMQINFYNFSLFSLNNDENIRKFLQIWGTNIIRLISDNSWIYLYLIRIYRSLPKFKKFKKIYILTDDVRFNNEITVILENKLIAIDEVHFIYLYKVFKPEDYEKNVYKHISENSLDINKLLEYNNDKLFIYIIKNNYKIDNIIKTIIKTNII